MSRGSLVNASWEFLGLFDVAVNQRNNPANLDRIKTCFNLLKSGHYPDTEFGYAITTANVAK